MTDKDDPFGLSGDAGRTRIRPQRGTATPPSPAPQPGPAYVPPPPPVGHGAQPAWGGGYSPPPPPAPDQSARIPRAARPHPNPLVTAFAPLLEIAPELERAAPPGQPETLRVRLLNTLIDARDAAVGMGIPLSRANQGAWFVAALLDDIALNTPWGGHSDWPRQPLVVSLSGEVDSGTRFFQYVEALVRHPGTDPDLLELAYLCLGLGFRGQYRVQGGTGEAALAALRAQIARQLRNPDTLAAPLSSHWRGVDVPDEQRRFSVPLWCVALVAVALISAIYVGLSVQLSNHSQRAYEAAARLPPAERAGIFRPARQTIEPVDAPPELKLEPVTVELLPLFEAAAPTDTRSAMKGREDVSAAVLVVQGINPEVFRSARADLNAEYLPLIASIAETILANSEVIGRINVAGYTDSVPVQSSNPFQSNQGLSEARAAAIAELLVQAGVPAESVTSEGRAERDPVGDNKTKEGRAQNRRIEIRIEKRL